MTLHQLQTTLINRLRPAYHSLPTSWRLRLSPWVRKLHAAQVSLPAKPNAAYTAQERSERYQALMGSIASEFDVSPGFVEAYFGNQSLDTHGARNWSELRAVLTPLQIMYLQFAFTTTVRARENLKLIEQHIPPKHAHAAPRHLDIGCGYGGFVRVFASAGYESTGIEIVPQLAMFSRLNTEHLKPAATIIEEDFLALEFRDQAAYDVITCNDVIEHVADADTALRKMIGLLNPGGLLQMEIPNKDCIDFVISDGHFQLFGIAQLRRDDAAAYHVGMTGHQDYLSHMGEFYEQRFYTGIMHEKGLAVTEIQRHQTGTLDQAESKLAQLQATWKQWQTNTNEQLPDAMRTLVNQHIDAYIAQYRADLSAAQADAGLERQFISRYLMSFWTLLAT